MSELEEQLPGSGLKSGYSNFNKSNSDGLRLPKSQSSAILDSIQQDESDVCLDWKIIDNDSSTSSSDSKDSDSKSDSSSIAKKINKEISLVETIDKIDTSRSPLAQEYKLGIASIEDALDVNDINLYKTQKTRRVEDRADKKNDSSKPSKVTVNTKAVPLSQKAKPKSHQLSTKAQKLLKHIHDYRILQKHQEDLASESCDWALNNLRAIQGSDLDSSSGSSKFNSKKSSQKDLTTKNGNSNSDFDQFFNSDSKKCRKTKAITYYQPKFGLPFKLADRAWENYDWSINDVQRGKSSDSNKVKDKSKKSSKSSDSKDLSDSEQTNDDVQDLQDLRDSIPKTHITSYIELEYKNSNIDSESDSSDSESESKTNSNKLLNFTTDPYNPTQKYSMFGRPPIPRFGTAVDIKEARQRWETPQKQASSKDSNSESHSDHSQNSQSQQQQQYYRLLNIQEFSMKGNMIKGTNTITDHIATSESSDSKTNSNEAQGKSQSSSNSDFHPALLCRELCLRSWDHIKESSWEGYNAAGYPNKSPQINPWRIIRDPQSHTVGPEGDLAASSHVWDMEDALRTKLPMHFGCRYAIYRPPRRGGGGKGKKNVKSKDKDDKKKKKIQKSESDSSNSHSDSDSVSSESFLEEGDRLMETESDSESSVNSFLDQDSESDHSDEASSFLQVDDTLSIDVDSGDSDKKKDKVNDKERTPSPATCSLFASEPVVAWASASDPSSNCPDPKTEGQQLISEMKRSVIMDFSFSLMLLGVIGASIGFITMITIWYYP